MPFMPMINDASRKNYHILADFLKRISYKPGWTIRIIEEQNEYAFNVVVRYDGYESGNAVSTPLYGNIDNSERSTAVAARLMGKTFRHPEKRHFTRKFSMLDLNNMSPENVIKYVIADTIKQAELDEFDRWFRID